MTLYKGYECYRNRLTGRFYGIPIGDDDMTRKIVRDTPIDLKQAIDEATTDRRLDPWQLPRRSAESIAA
jgi:hypothetical protein